MCPESFGDVRFDLLALLEGQMWFRGLGSENYLQEVVSSELLVRCLKL